MHGSQQLSHNVQYGEVKQPEGYSLTAGNLAKGIRMPMHVFKALFDVHGGPRQADGSLWTEEVDVSCVVC